MKILIYDVAAEDGGGLQVLKTFYHDVVEKSSNDIQWVFAVSQNVMENAKNVRIERYEKPKKSWVHRIIFENYDFPKILKKENPDLVISLQNMPVKRYSGRQFVYLHQSLQFCPKKFSFFISEERGLAIRQRIICNIYKNALPRSEHIFVQTKWIKEATMKWLHWQEDRITVVPVGVNTTKVSKQPYKGIHSRTFFYPARAEMYKNHEVILKACQKLVERGVEDFKVLFTVSRNDGIYAQKLMEASIGLPIEFIGTVQFDNMWDYYSKTIMLFPSYLETCGLPLLEARAAGSWIIASDMPFSHEALDTYWNKDFFKYDDPEELADCMIAILNGKEYRETACKNQNTASLVEIMLRKI